MPQSNHTTDYLANERTFLAWIRTSIAMISLGFVVAKFGVWLRELSVRLTPHDPIQSTGISMSLGIGLIALGGILAIVAAWHYKSVNNSIERGEPVGNQPLINCVAAIVVIITALMIVYMVTTSRHL